MTIRSFVGLSNYQRQNRQRTSFSAPVYVSHRGSMGVSLSVRR